MTSKVRVLLPPPTPIKTLTSNDFAYNFPHSLKAAGIAVRGMPAITKTATYYHPRLKAGWVYGIECGDCIKVGVSPTCIAGDEVVQPDGYFFRVFRSRLRHSF